MFKKKKPEVAAPPEVAAEVDLGAWFGQDVTTALRERFSPEGAQAFAAALIEDAKDRYLRKRKDGSAQLTSEELATLSEHSGGVTIRLAAAAIVVKAWHGGAREAAVEALAKAGLSPEFAPAIADGLTRNVKDPERQGAAAQLPQPQEQEKPKQSVETISVDAIREMLPGADWDTAESAAALVLAWPEGPVAKCDICGTENPAEGRFVGADHFRRIAAAGYNPFQGRGRLSPLYGAARSAGTSDESLLTTWLDMVRRDTGGWGVCGDCAHEVAWFVAKAGAAGELAADGRGHEIREIQALLVLSASQLDGAEALVEQIVAQQRAEGQRLAVEFITSVVVAGSSLDDPPYVYATLREAFPQLEASDLLERTRKFSFQAPNGNHGNYYIVFDTPRSG